LISRLSLIPEPVDAPQLALARAAYHRYGRAPARLNFGDRFAHALAKSLGAPLLFKEDGFAATDIEAVILP
jgi:ribonuclease VapC